MLQQAAIRDKQNSPKKVIPIPPIQQEEPIKTENVDQKETNEIEATHEKPKKKKKRTVVKSARKTDREKVQKSLENTEKIEKECIVEPREDQNISYNWDSQFGTKITNEDISQPIVSKSKHLIFVINSCADEAAEHQILDFEIDQPVTQLLQSDYVNRPVENTQNEKSHIEKSKPVTVKKFKMKNIKKQKSKVSKNLNIKNLVINKVNIETKPENEVFSEEAKVDDKATKIDSKDKSNNTKIIIDLLSYRSYKSFKTCSPRVIFAKNAWQ